MKLYSIILLCAALSGAISINTINSAEHNPYTGLTFDLQKGAQFIIVPAIHRKICSSQPFVQSAIATTGFYLTGNAMTPVTPSKDDSPESTDPKSISDAVNNLGYFAGNYTFRKIGYTASENGYDKDYLSSKCNNLNELLPDQMLGYTIKENIRPITQAGVRIATHPLTQELILHTIGVLVAQQCANYATYLNNK